MSNPSAALRVHLAKKQNDFTRPASAALQGKAYFTQPAKTLRHETLDVAGLALICGKPAWRSCVILSP
ncbi:MAG: hypothetical protein Q7U63_19445 [Polaromonas sp.]|uniref:hypothetical protein n=1 Tax=Polaromonas sp. TaxID=1869339 RepID=UPI002718E41A|nr:hypothetical protein [Polaromonas sp.]MDO9115959.1 hypothetical protein [Polaromonas sp.]MDP1889092.1 hypothetical protein [Polaromonas sp.]